MGNIYASCFLAVCLILASICLNIHQLLLFSNVCINTGIYLLLALYINISSAKSLFTSSFLLVFSLFLKYSKSLLLSFFLMQTILCCTCTHACVYTHALLWLEERQYLNLSGFPVLMKEYLRYQDISYLNSKWVISFLNLIFIKR